MRNNNFETTRGRSPILFIKSIGLTPSPVVPAVVPVPATRLGALLGNGPQLWVDMQSKYDLQQAEAKLHDVLAQIHRITDDHATA
jgi:hypothetical protein